MATEIESLQISINAKAQNANKQIDALVGRLDVLSKSLGRINGGSRNLNGLANGVDRLGRAMQTMNTVKTADFTRLANNLAKLGNMNVSALNSTASSLSHLTRAFNTLGGVSSNAMQVGTLAHNLSKLGSASMQRAVVNIPQLAVALNNLMTTLSRSPVVSQNVIQMTNALANLSAQGAKVGSASRSIERGLNRSSTSAERAKKSYNGLASAIGKFYATYFLFIRAIRGLGKSITSTADYIEAFNYFNVALGKIGSDWSHQFEQYGYDNAEAYANSFSERLTQSLSGLSGVKIEMSADGSGLLTESGMKNLGLNIQEITQYASQLASVTNSVGQTGEVSLAVASAFTRLGADISSLFNLDYSDVMKNLQSGLIGQSRALYKYGIDITNATLQTYAYELGLEKAVSEMTQAEKMQLRVLAVLDQSRVSWSDLSNTINSPSNMLRQFKNNLKEVGMILGQLFIPLMQRVMPVVNGVTIAIKRLLTNIAGFMGVKLDLSSFGQGYTEIEDEFDGIEDSVDGATEAIDKFKSHTLGIDELNVYNPDTSGADTSGLDNTIDLTEQIIDATEEYEKVWNEAFSQMENKAYAIADVFAEYFQPIEDLIKNLVEPTEEFIKSIAELYEELAPFTGGFGKGFLEFLGAFAEINLEIIATVFETLAKAIGLVPEDVLEAVGYGLGVLAGALVTISGINKISTLFSNLSGGLSTLGATLKAHPILSTFTLAAGITALYELFDKYRDTKAEETLGESWISGLDGLQDSAERAETTIETLSDQLNGLISGSVQTDLETYYKKWKELHDNLENLTKEEQGLLKVYSDKIKELFPQAKDYIDENGKAYEEMAKDIDEVIQKTIALAKLQGVEDIIGDLSKEEIQIKLDLENLEQELDAIIEKATVEFGVSGDNLEELAAQMVTYASTSGIMGDGVKLKLAEEYFQTLKAIETQKENLANIETSIDAAADYMVELKKETEETNVFFEGINDSVLRGMDSFTRFGIKIKKLEEQGINIPVKFAFETSINPILAGAKSALSALGIQKYEAGGYPSKYSLFMAGENGIPELMGTVGGKTAVAGGAEITGIREEIRNTANEEIILLRQQNELLARLLEKEVVRIGDRDIARANARGQRSMGYQLIT